MGRAMLNKPGTDLSVPGTCKKRHGLFTKKDNRIFLLMVAPVVLHLIIFNYLPMVGIVIAFQDFIPREGIFGSRFVGFRHFEFFIRSQDAWRVTRNTVGMNLLFIFLGLFFAVFFALMLYEVKKRFATKTYQTILILPNFLSWVVVGYMAFALLNPAHGFINNLLVSMGGEPIAWYSEPSYWPAILAIASIWRSVGVNSIIYYAALMGVSSEYYEAAQLDGANKFKQIIHISLPSIVPVMTILTILAIGNIFRADFGLFYQLTRDSGQLYPATDVIDTYVVRALRNLGEMSMSAAVGLFQSVVGFVLILITNLVVRKIDRDNALF